MDGATAYIAEYLTSLNFTSKCHWHPPCQSLWQHLPSPHILSNISWVRIFLPVESHCIKLAERHYNVLKYGSKRTQRWDYIMQNWKRLMFFLRRNESHCTYPCLMSTAHERGIEVKLL